MRDVRMTHAVKPLQKERLREVEELEKENKEEWKER